MVLMVKGVLRKTDDFMQELTDFASEDSRFGVVETVLTILAIICLINPFSLWNALNIQTKVWELNTKIKLCELYNGGNSCKNIIYKRKGHLNE
jgi:hypothetical protein